MIAFVYLLVPFVLAVGVNVVAGESLPGVALTAVVGLLAGLVAIYFLPLGLVRLATEDRFAAAFAIGTIAAVARSRRYLFGWVLATAVLIGGFVIAGLFNLVPILGLIPWAIAVFYVQVVVYRIYGRTYLAASGRLSEPPGMETVPATAAPE